MTIQSQTIGNLLGECHHRPDAGYHYDVMRGGLVWEDEFPSSYANMWDQVLALQILGPAIAYRASLTLGKPNKELEPNWVILKSIIPDWPGFRDERIYGDVVQELRLQKRLEKKCLGELEEWLEVPE